MVCAVKASNLDWKGFLVLTWATWAVTGAEMDGNVGGLGVEEDVTECSGGGEKVE